MAFKMSGWSAFKKEENLPEEQQQIITNKGIDPDAPGVPGEPGYEPPVEKKDYNKKTLTKAQKTAINERVKGAFDWLRKKQI